MNEGEREWLAHKPFGFSPDETARLLIDFALVVSLLELRPGVSLCELGCGPGWMTLLAARQGVDAVGFDISPEMIRIARERAEHEGVEARFDVGDIEALLPGRQFDACLVYDALHHTTRPELVLRTARRALSERGRLLAVEPNWVHRVRGRGASEKFGTTELGYTPRRLKRLLREAGFAHVERFHVGRRRVFGNKPGDVAFHIAQPFVVRALAPFATQIWLRAVVA